MAVIDTFMMNNELDMLRARLEEHDEAVDWFVIAEATQTHRGVPKPLWYQENRVLFAEWADRIIHVVPDLPDASDPWVRENFQRDSMLAAIDNVASDGDTVLVADVDEFPPLPLPVPDPVLAVEHKLFMYAVDWQHPDLTHRCMVAARWGWLKHRSLVQVRQRRHLWDAVEGGTHLTWLGGVEGQRLKLETATCHLEMSQADYDRIWSGACYRDGVHHAGERMMLPVDVDESWPKAVYERRCPESWFRPRG